MTTPRRRFFPFLLLNSLLLLSLACLLSLLPLASFSAFDENEASWTRGRWDTAPFKLPLPFRALQRGGGGREERERERGEGAKEAKSPSPSLSPSSSFPSTSSSSPSTSSFPASSLLGPLSDSSLALSATAREAALAADDWQRDERDVAEASAALGCDACRAAATRAWELGAAFVALQGRAEAKTTGTGHANPAAAAAAAAGGGGGANAAAANAAANAANVAPLPPPQTPPTAATTETVFLPPAQLRQRLRRGIRAWCQREGEEGAPGGRPISPGSALEGAKLVREEGGNGRWRRVERPATATTATATEAAAAAAGKATTAAKATTSARERLAARLACSSLLFSPPAPSPSSASVTLLPGKIKEQQPAADPLLVAALADGLSLFANALSRAANSDAAKSHSKDSSLPPQQQQQVLLPRTLFAGRRPDESGRLCADYHPECPGWASLGECEANPGYMIGDDDQVDFNLSFSGSSSSSSSSESKGASGSLRNPAAKRRRPGFCRFSCGVCSPLPRGFPGSSSSGPSSSSAALLAAIARLPPNSHEAAALEAEALAIKEGVLLRACYAAEPCGGRGGGEVRFGKWFEDEEEGDGDDDDDDEEREERERVKNATLASSSSSSSSLHKRCFVSAAGWWLYEVCVGGGIRQFHPPTGPRDAPAANSLGTFSNSSSSSESSASPKKVKWLSAPELYRGAPLREEAMEGESKVFAFVEQRYEGGDPCGESEEDEKAEGAVRRSATLRLVCPSHPLAKDVDSVPRLLVSEPETCVYVLTLFHPEACALVNGNGAAAAEEERVAAVETTTAAAAGAATTETAAVAAAAPPEAVAAVPEPLPAVTATPATPPPPATVPAAAHDEL